MKRQKEFDKKDKVRVHSRHFTRVKGWYVRKGSEAFQNYTSVPLPNNLFLKYTFLNTWIQSMGCFTWLSFCVSTQRVSELSKTWPKLLFCVSSSEEHGLLVGNISVDVNHKVS